MYVCMYVCMYDLTVYEMYVCMYVCSKYREEMIAAEKAGNPLLQNLLIGNKYEPMGKTKRRTFN